MHIFIMQEIMAVHMKVINQFRISNRQDYKNLWFFFNIPIVLAIIHASGTYQNNIVMFGVSMLCISMYTYQVFTLSRRYNLEGLNSYNLHMRIERFLVEFCVSLLQSSFVIGTMIYLLVIRYPVSLKVAIPVVLLNVLYSCLLGIVSSLFFKNYFMGLGILVVSQVLLLMNLTWSVAQSLRFIIPHVQLYNMLSLDLSCTLFQLSILGVFCYVIFVYINKDHSFFKSRIGILILLITVLFNIFGLGFEMYENSMKESTYDLYLKERKLKVKGFNENKQLEIFRLVDTVMDEIERIKSSDNKYDIFLHKYNVIPGWGYKNIPIDISRMTVSINIFSSALENVGQYEIGKELTNRLLSKLMLSKEISLNKDKKKMFDLVKSYMLFEILSVYYAEFYSDNLNLISKDRIRLNYFIENYGTDFEREILRILSKKPDEINNLMRLIESDLNVDEIYQEFKSID